MLARKYKQTSKFGDWYDHITDWMFFIGYLFVLYIRSKHRVLHISLILILLSLFAIQFGCMEKDNYKYYKEETSISRLRHICIKNDILSIIDNTILYAMMIYLIYHIN